MSKTFKDAINLFLQEKKDELSPNYLYDIWSDIRAIFEEEKSIESLTKDNIETTILNYVNVRGLSQNSAYVLFYRLKTFFNWLSPTTPLFTIKYERVKQKTLATLSKDEVSELLNKIKEDSNLDLYYVILFALNTGMRLGEIAALVWDKVNYTDRYLTVEYSYAFRLSKLGPTKNKCSRIVPLNQEALDALKHFELSKTEGVFDRVSSLKSGHIRKQLNKYTKKANLPNIRFHALRGIFAKNFLRNGGAVHTLQTICGWSDIKIAEKYLKESGKELIGQTDNMGLK